MLVNQRAGPEPFAAEQYSVYLDMKAQKARAHRFFMLAPLIIDVNFANCIRFGIFGHPCTVNFHRTIKKDKHLQKTF